MITTKRGYATLVISFLQYCEDNDEPAFIGKSINPWAAMFWMQWMAFMRGSSNSHKSWSASLTWLCAMLGAPSMPPLHQRHTDFALFWKRIKVAGRKKTKVKAQMQARHIWRYLRDCLKIDPDRLWLSSYDTLIEALLLVMMFLTMSRCTELLWSDKSDKVRKIITGVRFKHVDIRIRSGFRTDKVMTIEVVWFKNQQDRTLPKKVWMVTPCCGHSVKKCVCPFFAIMKLYEQIHTFRRNRMKNPKPFCNGKKVSPLSAKAAENLDIGDDNFLFVNSRGTILGYSFLYRLTRKVAAFNGLLNDELKMSPYSIRIGATSLAHHQNIDALKMMRWVEWQPGTACPTMHAHYVRYTVQQLSLVPFELLHGTLQFGEPTRNYIRSDPEVFELRNEVIRVAVYGGDAMRTRAHLKSRRQPQVKTPTFDPQPLLH